MSGQIRKRSCKFFIFGFSFCFPLSFFAEAFEFGLVRDGLMNLGILGFFLLSYLYCGSLVFTQAFSVPGVLEYFLYIIFLFCFVFIHGFCVKSVF